MVVKPGELPPFTGTFDCLRKTAAKEGIKGLYRGVAAPLLAVTPIFAVSFLGFDYGKKVVRWANALDGSATMTISQVILAGTFSALPQTLVMAPSERIKCLLQVQANVIESGGKAKYTGMADCVRQVYAEGGIRSIYRGTAATLLRDCPGNAAYFGTYEYVKRTSAKMRGTDPSELSLGTVIFAGGLAGMANWIVMMPLDVIKSRLQTAPDGVYSGWMDVARTLLKKEGPSALFKGIGPAMIRAFPANAATFLGVEWSLKLMSGL